MRVKKICGHCYVVHLQTGRCHEFMWVKKYIYVHTYVAKQAKNASVVRNVVCIATTLFRVQCYGFFRKCSVFLKPILWLLIFCEEIVREQKVRPPTSLPHFWPFLWLKSCHTIPWRIWSHDLDITPQAEVIPPDHEARGRCYDHNFLRFWAIFCEKNWSFSQKPMLWSKFWII
jgi:hypothetical protein